MNRTRLFIGAAVVALLVAGCGQETSSDPDDASASPVESTEPTETAEPEPVDFGDAPEGATEEFGLLLTPEDFGGTTSDDPTEIVIWTELGCPACASFFESSASDLVTAVSAGEATVEVRMATFLDRNSPNQHSTRASNLAACAYGIDGAGVFVDVLLALYDEQPAAGSEGPDDDGLVDIATAAGAGDDTETCFREQAYATWVQNGADTFAASGATGTPAALVDGELLEDHSALLDAIGG